MLNKEFSALEVTQAYFRRIKEHDKEIGAYLSLAEESATRDASAVDVALAEGETLGALAGVPLAIKDCILIKDLPATAASKILENYTAATTPASSKNFAASAPSSSARPTWTSSRWDPPRKIPRFMITHNPHDHSRVPGGSSGGSAAAVAAHFAVAALGSDTGGSVRQPAALCGVVGFKPTYGAVSRSGLIAMASSLDQIGPFGKTVEDAAILVQSDRRQRSTRRHEH